MSQLLESRVQALETLLQIQSGRIDNLAEAVFSSNAEKEEGRGCCRAGGCPVREPEGKDPEGSLEAVYGCPGVDGEGSQAEETDYGTLKIEFSHPAIQIYSPLKRRATPADAVSLLGCLKKLNLIEG